MKLFDLSGDVAVVTGATGALGGAVAAGLAAAGAKIAVLGRNQERGEACVKRITGQGGQARFFAADVMSRASLQNVHRQIQAAFGDPAILVNAAGGNDPRAMVTAERKFEEIELADWQRNFDLNLVGGVLLPCQEFGPGMASRGRGSIINFASASAEIPLSRVPAYSSAKGAVLTLTRFLAREWASSKTCVSTPSLPVFFPPNKTTNCSTTKTAPPPPARIPSLAIHRWPDSAARRN